MTEVLGDFIRALRSADVRVSTSESIDAGRVVGLVGLDDRMTLRDALAQVLAKSEDEKAAFEETFDAFFAFDQFKSRPPAANDDRADAADNAEAEGGEGEDGSPQQSGSPSAPGSGGMGGEPGEGEPAPATDLASLLERGDQAELQMALAEGARQAQLNRIRLFTQRGMFTRRIMELMGLDGLNEEIERRERDGDVYGHDVWGI